MKWNSKKSTYYGMGRKAYKKGDNLPADVLKNMGKETVKEYIKTGLILDEKSVKSGKKEADEKQRLALIGHAKELGLKPHPKTGIEKLNVMIDDAKALIDLKEEALSLGIDPSDDVAFADLTILVDEKKAENEPDPEK